MDIGLVLQTDPPAQAVVDLMVRAEGLGFSHGWTFDSHVLWQEPYVIYPRILERTSRMVVGPMVTNPGTRDWTVIASAARHARRAVRAPHDLRHRPGRLRDARAGPPATTLARLEAAIDVIRELAAGRSVDLGGTPVQIPWVAPGVPELPVWMAGYGPKALDLVGRCADGFILQLADPYLVEWTVKTVRSAAEAAGRDPAAITICVAAPAYVGDDLAHARDQCRWFGGMVGNHVADLVTRYGAESAAVPAELTGYIKGREGYDYSHHGRAGNPTTDFVPDEVVDRFCLLGPAVGAARPARGPAGARRGPVRDLRHARRERGDDRGVRTVGDPGPLTGEVLAPTSHPSGAVRTPPAGVRRDQRGARWRRAGGSGGVRWRISFRSRIS